MSIYITNAIKKKIANIESNVVFQVPEIDVSTLAKMYNLAKKFQGKKLHFYGITYFKKKKYHKITYI